jgi:hypothetical protein
MGMDEQEKFVDTITCNFWMLLQQTAKRTRKYIFKFNKANKQLKKIEIK